MLSILTKMFIPGVLDYHLPDRFLQVYVHMNERVIMYFLPFFSMTLHENV